MNRGRSRRATSVAVGVLIAALAVSALSCTSRSRLPVPQSPGVEGAGPSGIGALTPGEKRSAVASSFPIEVPVVRGRVVRARAQGETAWDYELEVEADPASVLAWYRDAYLGRQWVIVGSGELDGGNGGFLDFRKNRAESSVRAYPSGDGRRSRVVVTVGIGTPVLEAQ